MIQNLLHKEKMKLKFNAHHSDHTLIHYLTFFKNKSSNLTNQIRWKFTLKLSSNKKKKKKTAQMKLHKRKRQNRESWEQLLENVKLNDQQCMLVDKG